ncbi:B- and T-lymphocyte attenuator-like protein [Labeo rohita]|uniref:B-and T-lymphocyte attenuator-like protein n=1 Tax=Labeo rohita TaxID=84645 RepID=A0A498LAA8_LABRO|nr:B- and T-lymphocyte attenuator-like protein [Labeo rohita]
MKQVQEKRKTKMIICNLAVSLLLLSLSVSGTANGSEINCISVIKVPRKTVFQAPVMSKLKINCTVILQGCDRNPRISWYKFYGNDFKALNYSNHMRSEWKNITVHEGMAFLIFQNISMEDAGSYRCKGGDTSVSHTINVTVTGNVEDKVSHNQSNSILGDLNTTPTDDVVWFWPYVYICSGIAGLVLIVITVTLLIIRCQGTKSTRKDITVKTQYMETQRGDLPPPPPSHHNTRSPSNQLTSTLYRDCKTPPIRGSSARRVANGSHNTVGTKRGEEENALVYASLNHQAQPRVPRRTARQEPEPEPSEYAAIRVR